jgi:hypothetical protein
MSDPSVTPHGFRRFCCNHCGNTIDVPVHCTDKTCEPCTSFRRWRIQERINHALVGLPSNQTLRWRHVTLTVRNSPDLKDRLDHLIKSFRKLRHRKLWKDSQFGGFYVVEITEGKDGWHPHLHIVSYGHFIPLRKFSYVWRQITKDSHRVHIATIRDGQNIARYVSKYITKAGTLSAPSVIEVNSVCKNRRLFGPFGKIAQLMKKFKPPDKFGFCSRCNRKEWIPDFILDMMKRQAAS